MLFVGNTKRNRLILAPVICLILFLIVFSGNYCQSFAKTDTLSSDDTIRFAHISDVHYQVLTTTNQKRLGRLLQYSPILLEAALKEVAAIPGLDFLIFTGDSVNAPRIENFQGFFSLVLRWISPEAFYMALGNHDVGVRSDLKKQNTINLFRSLGGVDCFPADPDGWYSFTPKPWLKAVVMDATTDEKITSQGFIPDKELNWLKQELDQAEAANQMVIIFSHFPLVEPIVSYSHRIRESDASKLLEIVENNRNVVAYFAGHYHTARIAKHNGIYYISSPSLVEYPNAFRVATISKNGFLSLTWNPTSLKELSEQSRINSPYAQTSLGNPLQDHQLVKGQLRFSVK